MRMKWTMLKIRRFQRGLLQLEVAKRAAIPCGRLSELESGKAEPHADELQRLARVLDVSPQLLRGFLSDFTRQPTAP